MIVENKITQVISDKPATVSDYFDKKLNFIKKLLKFKKIKFDGN